MTATSDTGAPMRRSSREPEAVRTALESWLTSVLGADAAPRVINVHGTDANGMSSDTVLFDASWQDNGSTCDEALVARVAPDAADVPVFPTYDMQGQFDVIRLVGELSGVPVPDDALVRDQTLRPSVRRSS